MSKIIAVVWVVPLGNRWGVKHDDKLIVEDKPQWAATEAAEAYAAELRKTIPIVNVKTEKPKPKRWRKS